MLVIKVLKYLLAGSVAIHDRHAEVQNDKVKLFLRLGHHLVGFQPIDCFCDFDLGDLQNSYDLHQLEIAVICH